MSLVSPLTNVGSFALQLLMIQACLTICMCAGPHNWQVRTSAIMFLLKTNVSQTISHQLYMTWYHVILQCT
jgi:hypothetical protein